MQKSQSSGLVSIASPIQPVAAAASPANQSDYAPLGTRQRLQTLARLHWGYGLAFVKRHALDLLLANGFPDEWLLARPPDWLPGLVLLAKPSRSTQKPCNLALVTARAWRCLKALVPAGLVLSHLVVSFEDLPRA